MPKHRFLITHYFLLITSLLLPYPLPSILNPQPVLALDLKDPSIVPWANRSLSEFITPLISFSVVLAGVIAFLITIVGGIMTISGSGNPEAQEKAKTALTYGALGLGIVVAAYWIIQIIEVITGVAILNPTI